jgi:thymidine phosphorylase
MQLTLQLFLHWVIVSELSPSLLHGNSTCDVCFTRLYALRDASSTVASTSLICGSILSKKLAEGIHSLVLDVKFGGGAFMKTEAQAAALATQLVDISSACGRPAVALLSAMNEPLGRSVGNALEVLQHIFSLLLCLTLRLLRGYHYC